ncbi:MAG: hypothetical protein LBH46_03535 [Rickettsiales bacterium]|jgi:hypothetical protein|nr:hypothetical protein [Rickettsiales bacterium]
MRVVLKVFCFIDVFVILLFQTNRIDLRFPNWKTNNFQTLYKQDKLDVITIGTSHIITSFIPSLLYKEFGLTSYNLGMEQQPASALYYTLIEAVKKQPQAVYIIDVFSFFLMRNYSNNFIYNNFGEMDSSLNKLKAIKHYSHNERINYPQSLKYIFPIFKTHSNLFKKIRKKCGEDDMWCRQTIFNDYYKGYVRTNDPIPPNVYGINDESRGELVWHGRKYLEKTIKFAKDKNIKIFLIKTPDSNCKDCKRFVNTIEDIAKENGIPFADYNKFIEGRGHIHYSGAKDHTILIGKDLIKFFNVKVSKPTEDWDGQLKVFEELEERFGKN